MGWFANIFLMVGVWFIGDKKRWAFLLTAFGEVLYVIYASILGLWDLAAVCGVFALLAIRSYIKWSDPCDTSPPV